MDAALLALLMAKFLPSTERFRSFTSWNCILVAYCLVTRNRALLPFVFCSSVAVNNSFHFAEVTL